MTSNKTVIANYLAVYTLTVSRQVFDATGALVPGVDGGGAVTSVPPGIQCGFDCSEAYLAGTQVTLTATPAEGFQFTGWSGACTGTNPCAVSMTENRSVTASFRESRYTLTVNSSGASGVTITSSTGHDGTTNYTRSVHSGTAVSLTAPLELHTISSADVDSTDAMPTSRYAFSGWTGGVTSSNATIGFTMSADLTVTANYLPFYELYVSTSGEGMVTSVPEGISCGTDCSEYYLSGTSVALTATPAAGYYFAGWSGGCSGLAPCVVPMNGSTTVTANFSLLTACTPGGVLLEGQAQADLSFSVEPGHSRWQEFVPHDRDRLRIRKLVLRLERSDPFPGPLVVRIVGQGADWAASLPRDDIPSTAGDVEICVPGLTVSRSRTYRIQLDTFSVPLAIDYYRWHGNRNSAYTAGISSVETTYRGFDFAFGVYFDY